jgi:hypothetical protein
MPEASELLSAAMEAAQALLEAGSDGGALLLPTRSADECASAAAAEAAAEALQAGRAAVSRVWRARREELREARDAAEAEAQGRREAREAEEAALRAEAEAKAESERRRRRRNELAVWRAEKQKADEEAERAKGADEAGAVSAAAARVERRAIASRRRVGEWHAAGRPKRAPAPARVQDQEGDQEAAGAPQSRGQKRVESGSSLRERASAAVEAGSERLRRVRRKQAEEKAAQLRAQGLVARVAQSPTPSTEAAGAFSAPVGVPGDQFLEVRAPTSVLKPLGKDKAANGRARRNPGRVYRPTAATRAGAVSGEAVVRRAAALASEGAHGRLVPSTKGATIRKGIDYTFGGPTRVRAVPAWRKGL